MKKRIRTMATKQIGLALLWLTSILGTVVLTVFFTGSACREWEDSPLIRKLTHWREPVVARIGDTPIFKSDLVATLNGLPEGRQEAMRKGQNINELVQLTINQYLWRKAAIERGALKSETYKARLETAESESAESWVAEDLLQHELAISEAEIEAFGRRDPKLLAECHSVIFHVDRYVRHRRPGSRKDAPVLLGSNDDNSVYYVGIPNPAPVDFVAGLPLQKPSALVPCGKDLCRYTKLLDMILAPPGWKASSTLKIQKKATWLNSYRDRQGIKVESPVNSDIFQR
jgi:hypothetical protein